jgi:Ca-activated chloride channel family protein
MFSDKIYLLLLIILPISAYFFFVFLKKRKSSLKLFFSEYGISKLSNVNFKSYQTKFFLLLTALFFIILALARPQFGEKNQTLIRESSEIAAALDVSRSMLARDIEPNRIERAKDILTRVIDENPGERIGVIAFSGSAMWQCPMTYDSEALKMFLRDISVGRLPMGGTQISDAVSLAVKSLQNSPSNNKVLILISDGEDHDSKIEQAVKEAKNSNLRIISIGIGTATGAPIPSSESGIEGYIKDSSGEIVLSKLNSSLLRDISQKTGGLYLDASQRDLFAQITRTIQNLDKNKKDSIQKNNKADRFQIFLFFALLALIAELLIPAAKKRQNNIGD